MGLQIVVTVKEGATNKDIAAALRFQAGLLEGMDPKAAASRTNTDTEEQPVAKKGKAKTEEETFDLGIEGEGEAEEAVTDEAAAMTVEDVISTFKDYVKANPKGGKDKIAKILAKHKVKSVHALKANQYQSVVDSLG